MILSNIEIINCLNKDLFSIKPLQNSKNPIEPPFNTSAIDLRLANEVFVPSQTTPVQIDLKKKGISAFLDQNSKCFQISDVTPFSLKPNNFGKALFNNL
jgi:dCTP deaminase